MRGFEAVFKQFLSWSVVWPALWSDACMLPPLQSHGKTTIFHICLFSSPCFPPKSGVRAAGRNTPLLTNVFIGSTDDISFVKPNLFPSQLQFGVRILHTSFPQVEREVCSYFFLPLCRLSTGNITTRELARDPRVRLAWARGAEGSLSPLSTSTGAVADWERWAVSWKGQPLLQ